MSNKRFKLLAVPLVIPLCVLLLACESEQGSIESSMPELIKAVKTLVIKTRNGSTERVLAGTTVSSDEQSLSFRVSGVIVELPVQVGDVLKKDDLVAKLDSTDYGITVQQAKASVAQAKASAVSAKSNYSRAKELYSAQAASLADLESARANADSAKASLAVAKQQLNSASKNVQYTVLRSGSDSCSVIAVPNTINSNVSAGSPVVKLSCGSHLRVKVVVPENLIDQVKTGDRVSVLISSLRETAFSGDVVEVAVSNNNAAGFDVEIELLDSVPGLRVGVAASVVFEVSNGNGLHQIVLPSHAVMEDVKGNFVYVLTASEQQNVFFATRKNVGVGELQNEGLFILSGLVKSDEVIVSGVSRVSEKMKVKRIKVPAL